MPTNLSDLNAFLAVAKARGFRGASRETGASPTTLSEAVRRLEDRLGVRLLHRTTRSVTATEAGERLMDRLVPALSEVESALDSMKGFLDAPAGRLKLNVPVAAARVVLPKILPEFLARYPDIEVEIVTDDSFVDMAAGSDAGIRYDDRLEQDMIAVPIGPRAQRFAFAAAPGYLKAGSNPVHPRDLLNHACLLGRRAHESLGIRTERRDDKYRAARSACGQRRWSDGSCRGYGRRGCGHCRPVRRLAPSAS